MLSKIEISVMEILRRQGTYITSEDIGNQLSLSDRTTRKYLKNLSELIENHGATIQSKRGYGYRLVIESSSVFDSFWQEELLAKRNLKDALQIEEITDRKHYILNRLFFEDTKQSVDDLAKELFISRTTLNGVFSSIREDLRPYNIALKIDKKVISIVGNEADIRHFIMDYFFGHDIEESMYSIVENHFITDIDFAELTIFVLDECRDAKLKLSDFVIQNLVLHIALMIQRIRLGYQLSVFDISSDVEMSEEYDVALKILNRVETAYKVIFPKEEANYIALHLTVKKSSHRNSIGISNNLIEYHLKEKLREASSVSGIPFYLDNDLINGLLAHMRPLLRRLESNIQMTNPLTQKVTEDYFEFFELTKHTFQDMKELKSYEVTDDEWAYVTLHLMAAIERYTNKNKLKVLVVCATGYGSALMLRNRLEKEFGGSLQIVDTISYYELSEKRLQSIDVIISSISLSHLMFLTPVINVSVFLNQEDIANVRNYLSNQSISHLGNRKETSLLGIEKVTQIIEEMFLEKKFIYFEENISKDEALDMMVNCLDEAKDSQFRQQFIKQVELRESYGSVVFGDAVAVPHPSLSLSYTEQIVIGVFKEPISWYEEQKVNFVFLLSPSKGNNPYLKYISPSLVNFIENDDLQNQLLKEPTIDKVKKIFIPLIREY
ncbi:BglG family transcription antiterminator [Streptococcus pluranimalium]|uniref:BglG family transcription antiterminator n=1 Tax=Streptococcus pluranimalium TaxID=82348 RepID=UPI003F67C2D4